MSANEIIRKIIQEELKSILMEMTSAKPLQEKSVPEPYDRKRARKMKGTQISARERIGKAMLRDEAKVSKFKKKYGEDWKDHLWAAASAAAFREK